MKRLISLTVFTAVVIALLGIVSTPDQAYADRPSPSKQQQSFFFTHTVDSTAFTQDTSETPTNSSTKLMRFTDADRYGTVTGWFALEILNIDTGTAGVVVDTALDTVTVQFLTSDVSGTPNKLIFEEKVTLIHESAGLVNSDYILFTLSDSTLLDNTYMRIISALADSTFTKARLAAGIDYKVTVKTQGK